MLAVYLIIIGAAAGFLATRMMRLDTNIVTTIAIGIAGALVGGLVLRVLLAMMGHAGRAGRRGAGRAAVDMGLADLGRKAKVAVIQSRKPDEISGRFLLKEEVRRTGGSASAGAVVDSYDLTGVFRLVVAA